MISEFMSSEMPLAELIAAIYSSGVTLNVLYFLLAPITALVGGIGVSIAISQIVSLIDAAHRIDIDLLQLTRYSAITNPGTRAVVVVLVVLSQYPLASLGVESSEQSAALMKLMLFLVIAVTPVISLYFYPVVILRNRIKGKKEKELDAVLRSLQGDDEAIKTLSLQSRGAPTSTQDFLTYQMFVESRWEWPIAAHVQKLVLFGLLPPFAWVLAAAIENVMF
jgi:hypothetical protein